MTHEFHRVRSFERLESHVLKVRFDDGTEQTIDFLPVLGGKLFGPLRDPSLFAQVSIDPVAHTLVWPNDADFDPDMLHDWPRYEAALIEQTKQWEMASVRSDNSAA